MIIESTPYSHSKQLRLISDNESSSRVEILFLDSSNASRLTMHGYIDKSPFIRSPLVLPHESHLSRIYGGVYCYKITVPPSPLTQQWSDSGSEVLSIEPRCRLFWIVSHREPVKNPSSNDGEIERPRVLHHLWFTKRDERGNGTERGSLSWNEHRELTWLREIISA